MLLMQRRPKSTIATLFTLLGEGARLGDVAVQLGTQLLQQLAQRKKTLCRGES